MDRINGAAKAIREVCGEAEIGLVLGSGLGGYAETLKDAKVLPYADIPGFPVSTVPGHSGEWRAGTLGGKSVLMMRGRFHGYEGYDPQDIVLPVRAMKLLGVKTLILTNAAGGINKEFSPGDLMAITDFINMTGKSPLTGPNLDALGPRFPDMSRAFDPALRALTKECAHAAGIRLREGVYAQMPGPSFETPAEIRMLRILGADAVGMSTVPETVAARHCGINVLGLSCITNMAAGILDQPLSHEEVMETGLRTKDAFRALLDALITRL